MGDRGRIVPLKAKEARHPAPVKRRARHARALIGGCNTLDQYLARNRPLSAVSRVTPRDIPQEVKAAEHATIEGLLLGVSYALR